ncbi:hypothetical protein ABT294_26365 [Nonomuraea sp. NPDC000554]|uniref:hypothetical protein n=1 Tax=Nonomuraea sp. NPDC000554 TaxID=3154259 RepID=UPI00331D0E51
MASTPSASFSGAVDAADVGQSLLARAVGIDVGGAFGVEHLLERAHPLDPGEGVVATAHEPDVITGLEIAQVRILHPDLDGLAAGGDQAGQQREGLVDQLAAVGPVAALDHD